MKTCNKALPLATEQPRSYLHPADSIYVLQDRKPPCSGLGVNPRHHYWHTSYSKEVLKINNNNIQILQIL